MEMQYAIVALFLVAEPAAAMIYSINATEYNKMPPLYALDDYGRCLLETDASYCLLDLDLFSRSNSSLMQFIQAYSDYTIKHYNHTQIHRGVCVKRSCRGFLKDGNNRTVDQNTTLERCLNESVWNEYQIEAKLARIRYCKRSDDKITYDASDYVVAVIYLVLIVLNVIGTFYDLKYYRNNSKEGNPYLMAFSINRNWMRMVAPIGAAGSEPKLERLKLFHGLRTMTMICVIFSHTVLVMAHAYVDNPLYVEKSYDDPLKQILFNGSLVTHTFFVMSSFLLAYNLEIHAQNHRVTWWLFPKGIFLRWIRLTPTYALVFATISTWMRYIGDGPMWQLLVTSEAIACRQYWWAHVFYINNYVYDDAYCAPQTWYLAADTQLFCLGLLVCVFARTNRARKVVLSMLIIMSLIIPALHTYLQDLDAVVIQSPESYRNLYETDPTFRLLYIRGHTNMSTFVLGLIGGLLTFHWQTEHKDFAKYKKLRWIVWLLVPSAIAVILSGGLFYMDGSTPSVWFRVAYAALYKPIFQTLVVCFIISVVFKVESVYRGIVEWRGFTWTGRVSYSAFLCHTLFQRGLVGAQTVPTHMSDYYVVVILLASVFMSYLCGALLWLLVEAPLGGVTKAVMGGGHGGDQGGERRRRDCRAGGDEDRTKDDVENK